MRMVSWNLNTLRFEGDWTPQSFSDNIIGYLGMVINHQMNDASEEVLFSQVCEVFDL